MSKNKATRKSLMAQAVNHVIGLCFFDKPNISLAMTNKQTTSWLYDFSQPPGIAAVPIFWDRKTCVCPASHQVLT